jgi:glucosamine-6-phosphate deaminase
MITAISTKEQNFVQEKIPVTVYSNATEASNAVAHEIANLIKQKQAEGKMVVLGFATGSTPKKVYAALIRLHQQGQLSFSNVIAFNLDEYYGISSNSLQTYKRFMQEHLFNHVDIDSANCFIPDGNTPQELVKFSCEEYEKKIQEAGGIDFQLLGIGRNGHIGFNEPGSYINSSTRLITLDLSTRSDASFDFGGLANVPRKAITMGVSTILKAKRIVLLAWGERKAAIIQQATEGAVTELIPANTQ